MISKKLTFVCALKPLINCVTMQMDLIRPVTKDLEIERFKNLFNAKSKSRTC